MSTIENQARRERSSILTTSLASIRECTSHRVINQTDLTVAREKDDDHPIAPVRDVQRWVLRVRGHPSRLKAYTIDEHAVKIVNRH